MRRRFKTARCILYRDGQYLLAVHNRFRHLSRQRWGLIGGQVEWGESPRVAAARELEEELEVTVGELIEVGAYSYKQAMHMVYAAPAMGEVGRFDTNELIDVGWFSEPEVAGLRARSALHADYELDAIQRLRRQLDAPGRTATG
ncbi:MAG: NUDIX hydrolase [Pseudomonadales bacterium]